MISDIEGPGNSKPNSTFETNVCRRSEKPKKGTWIVKLSKLRKCRDCNIFLIDFNQFKKHKKVHTKMTFEKSTCDFCKEEFENDTLLQEHKRLVHNMKPFCKDSQKSNVEKTKKEIIPTNKCKICGKKYTTANNLTRHIKHDHEGIEYKCDKCDKIFKSYEGLDFHKKTFHEKIRYQCKQCNSYFTAKIPFKFTFKAFMEASNINVIHVKRNLIHFQFCGIIRK